MYIHHGGAGFLIHLRRKGHAEYKATLNSANYVTKAVQLGAAGLVERVRAQPCPSAELRKGALRDALRGTLEAALDAPPQVTTACFSNHRLGTKHRATP